MSALAPAPAMAWWMSSAAASGLTCRTAVVAGATSKSVDPTAGYRPTISAVAAAGTMMMTGMAAGLLVPRARRVGMISIRHGRRTGILARGHRTGIHLRGRITLATPAIRDALTAAFASMGQTAISASETKPERRLRAALIPPAAVRYRYRAAPAAPAPGGSNTR